MSKSKSQYRKRGPNNMHKKSPGASMMHYMQSREGMTEKRKARKESRSEKQESPLKHQRQLLK